MIGGSSNFALIHSGIKSTGYSIHDLKKKLSEENDLRQKLKLPTYKNYQEFLDREEDPDSLNVEFNVLDEAANILGDLIEIKSEPILASLERAS